MKRGGLGTRLIGLAAAGPAAALAISLTAPWWWIGELAIHWAGHVLLASLVAAALLARAWPRRAGALVALATITGVVLLPTLLRPRAPEAAAGTAVRVAHGNLYLYNDRALRPQALDRLREEDPEILSLVEAIASEDRPRLGLERWPYQVWQPQLNRKWRDSIALLSRHPILKHEAHDIDGQPFLTATLDVQGRPLHVLVAHTAAPITAELSANRLAQFGRIAQVVEALVARQPAPVLALGDFNCTVRSPGWQTLTGAGLLTATITPATWHRLLGPGGITIDHVLGRDLAISGLRAFTLAGSDHRGLAATVMLP